jgi:hypothetical protein
LRIAFAIMSAQQSPLTVTQLADALAPHTVVIHHDFRKRADFRVDRPNVRFVPNPKVTGWGDWGFTEGIFHAIDYCVNNVELDYFQLLSPTCLPIRPIREFEEYVRTSPCDIHGDFIPVEQSDDLLMHFGFRSYVKQSSLFYRPMRRAQRWYFGPDVQVEQYQSLSVRRRTASYKGPIAELKARVGLAFTKAARAGLLSNHPFGANFRPHMGSTWVGLNLKACNYLLARRNEPMIHSYFKHLAIVDETLFATLLANSNLRIGAGNHLINTFSAKGNPAWFDDQDMARIVASERFFARKFPDDVNATVRVSALRHLSEPRDEPLSNPQDGPQGIMAPGG